MKNRYFFIDNLRWVTVLLVLLYHVFYNFNGLGIFGAIGGFAEGQPQDVICTLLHPWFMVLLFVLAGASSRYALQRRTTREFRRERTRKLLVPTTLGLFVFGWVLGTLNTAIAGATLPAELPLFVKYFIAIASGTGHLWFLQDLFGFSLLLLLVRRIATAERVDEWLSKVSDRTMDLLMVGFFALLWATSQTQFDEPVNAEGLINLYRPVYYFVAFLVGYYIFSSERTHAYLAARARVLVALAVVGVALFGWSVYGKDYTHPSLVQSAGYNLYVWVMTLAMVGAFGRWANGTSKVADYMTRSSFGVYVVHMTVCTGACWWLKTTALPVWAIYSLALVITFVGSFVLWEIMRRVPFVRYCVFGIKKSRTR